MADANAPYQPDLSRFSEVTFWDTAISRIDWARHAGFVIERVFSYGTDDERRCVADFYGTAKLKDFLAHFHPNAFNRRVSENINAYLHAAL